MIGIDRERSAVEDEFVLAAELVGVEQRQATLDHLADRHLVAHGHLGAVIRRAVRHQQNFGAALSQRLADAEFAPDVLTDRDAQAHAAEIDRSGHVGTGLEDAFLVELAIVGQVDLEAFGNDLAAVGDDDRVVQPALAPERHADDDARSAVAGFAGEFLGRALTGRNECRLQHQVLRRITGNEQLGEQHEVGALPRRVRPRLARLGEVAGNIADRRVELGNCNAQDIGRFFRHVSGLACVLKSGNAVRLGHHSSI